MPSQRIFYVAIVEHRGGEFHKGSLVNMLGRDAIDRCVDSRCQGLEWASESGHVIKNEARLPIY